MGLVAARVLLIVLACTLVQAKAQEAASEDSSPSDKAAATDTGMLHSCLSNIVNKPGAAVFPGDGAYDDARRTANYRTIRNPAAVFYACTTQQVSAAVVCAKASGLSVSVASGRHGFTGDSVMDGYVVIDLSAMNRLAIGRDNRTIAVGPGVSGGVLQSYLLDSGIQGAEVPSGTCTWVGVGGFTLGGGMGPSGRYLGLACDQLVAVEMVLSDGSVVRADKEHHPDLLWASCGGGGGTFGIVTSFTFRISILPNHGILTALELKYANSKAATVRAVMRMQNWLPHMDYRYGIDGLSFGNGFTGPSFSVSGVYFGDVDDALRGLEAAGVLQDLDPTATHDASSSDVSAKYPYGLRLKGGKTMYDVYFEVAPFWSSPFFSLPTPWAKNAQGFADIGYRGTPEEVRYLSDLLRGRSPYGQVVGGPLYHYAFLYSQSRMTGIMDEATVEAIVDHFDAASTACRAATSLTACLYVSAGHILGGAYSHRLPEDTAYPHRDKFFVFAAQTVVSDQLLPLVQPGDAAQAYTRTDDFVRLLDKQGPYARSAAYVNYMNPPGPLFTDWQDAYFGDNYPRLQRIKATYDPEGLFTKPLTVGASNARYLREARTHTPRSR